MTLPDQSDIGYPRMTFGPRDLQVLSWALREALIAVERQEFLPPEEREDLADDLQVLSEIVNAALAS